MKKKLYLLFGFIMSLLLVGVVNAEEPFHKGWETEKIVNEIQPYYNAQYQDGYITVDQTYTGSLITIYDSKGEILKEKEFNNKYVMNVLIEGDKIFFVEEQWSNGNYIYYVREYNNKLTVQNEIQVYEPYYYYIEYAYPDRPLLRIDGDLYFVCYGSGGPAFLKLEEDLSDYEEIYEPSLIEKLPETIGDGIVGSYERLDHLRSFDLDGKKTLIGAYFLLDEPNCALTSPNSNSTAINECFEIRLILKDGKKEVFNIVLPEDYEFIDEVKIVDKFVAAIVYDGSKNYALIYDQEGELVQEITLNRNSYGLEATERGFIINEMTCRPENVITGTSPQDPSKKTVKSSVKETQKAAQRCTAYHTVYHLIREIKSEITEGKGKVEVVSQETPGEPVTFVVTPDEGYVIGVVKVTDSEGNVITFTKDELKGNTFTMPNSDVTIEVEFLVQNANTTDVAIMTAAVLAGFAFIMILISKKAIKE